MSAVLETQPSPSLITYDTHPDRYVHWKLSFDGQVATLSMDVDEDKGLKPGYKLKLNSYDLGVDIELADALNRVRFEHPEVKSLVITSARERMFCSGANIYMLGSSTHAWKVNFCKFTNETRNGIEDSSRHEGLKVLAAVNGTVAGGGYELALACDEILMIDDRSSTVSLPELPLLGVLPGTGGLTRVTDKRKVRRDLADVFCTTSEGVRADRAKQWKLVDHIAKPQGFKDAVAERVAALAAQSARGSGKGVTLNALKRSIDAGGYHYDNVDVVIDRKARTATITVFAPRKEIPSTIEPIRAAGDTWWPLAMARELDAAVLMLRTNDLEIGTWIFNTRRDGDKTLAARSSTRTSLPSSVWSLSRLTISTGTRRWESRSRSTRASPPTRSPAWKRISASRVRKAWKRASSPDSAHGRTGSLLARMLSENTARSRCTAVARRPDSIGSGYERHRLFRENPQQRQPRQRPHAAARARALAAALSRLVARDGAQRLRLGRRLSAHGCWRGRARLGTLRHGEDARLSMGHFPGRSHRGPYHRLRGLLRPAGVAAGARRIPLAVPPPYRHPRGYGTRFGRAAAPAPPHLTFPLRPAPY